MIGADTFWQAFRLFFLANVYMSLFALLRQAIKKEKVEIEKIENETDTEKLST
jgi:hypothetical protein